MVLHINSPQSSSISITDNTEKESVDEIRQRIHSLRQMVEDEVGEKQNLDELKKSSKKERVYGYWIATKFHIRYFKTHVLFII